MSQTNPNTTSYISYLTPTGALGQTGASPWPTTNKAYKALGTCSGNRFLALSATSSAAPHPPFKPRPSAWVYNPGGTAAQALACLNESGPCLGGSRAVPIETVEDIERTLVCKIVGSDNITYTATSEAFTEGSGSLAPIVCPQLPAGVTIASLTVTEEGGSTSFDLLQQGVTDAYVHWWETYPECVNGSCLLDLRQNGDSCFTAGVDCDGWFTAPDRDSTYTCRYGTHTIALAGCYVYATVFSSSHQDDGTAYADPITGDPVETPTSPTEVDRLTQRMLERGWLVHGPTPAGFVYGATNPYQAARTVAQTCVAMDVRDECERLPIFAPGDNVREAAQHDLDAILHVNPAWVLLNRQTPSPAPPGWYSAVPPCVTGTYESLTHECDEYPFSSTAQAGPGASLRVIDWADNQNEGTYLSIFYTQCEIVSGDPYLVIPIPTPEPLPRTTRTSAWCSH
jgi:hypothetical protein